MMRGVPRLLRLFIALPVLCVMWSVFNTMGVTAAISQVTGVPISDDWEIPGLASLLKAREASGEFASHLAAEATGKVSEKAADRLRAELDERYGPEAAALVPDRVDPGVVRAVLAMGDGELSASEMATLATTLDVDSEEMLAATGLAKPGSGSGSGSGGGSASARKAGKVPFMNAKAYKKALVDIETLPVKGKAAKTGYSREQFGSEWSDTAGDFPWTRNGLDTRNDVLSRDLVAIECKSGTTSKTGSCKVLRGTLPYDPYSGETNYRFDAEDGEYSTDLDIEHVRALGDIWVHGGQNMTAAERAAIANDPLNLMAVNPSDNRSKGDADFASWVPPNKAYRCAYAARTVAITRSYPDLWITSAEKDAMKRTLAACV